MRDLPQDAGEYLSALRNIRNLSLCDFTIEYIGEEVFHTCFSVFRETLSQLSLFRVAMSLNMFVTLVGYFPNITRLRLGPSKLQLDEGPVPSLPQPLRGEICLYNIDFDSRRFIDRMAGLDMKYDTLIVKSSYSAALVSILQLSPNTIKYLSLEIALGREQP